MITICYNIKWMFIDRPNILNTEDQVPTTRNKDGHLYEPTIVRYEADQNIHQIMVFFPPIIFLFPFLFILFFIKKENECILLYYIIFYNIFCFILYYITLHFYILFVIFYLLYFICYILFVIYVCIYIFIFLFFPSMMRIFLSILFYFSSIKPELGTAIFSNGFIKWIN